MKRFLYIFLFSIILTISKSNASKPYYTNKSPEDTIQMPYEGLGYDLGLTMLSFINAGPEHDDVSDFGFGGALIGLNLKTTGVSAYMGIGINMQMKNIPKILNAFSDNSDNNDYEEDDNSSSRGSLTFFSQFIPYYHTPKMDFGAGIFYSTTAFEGEFDHKYVNKVYSGYGPVFMIRTYLSTNSSLNFYYQLGLKKVQYGIPQNTSSFIISINFSK